jgi:hypothetical protein
MLTLEESRLLARLRSAGGPLEERQFTDFPAPLLGRVLADLEWRGLVVVLRGGDGGVALLTPRGRELTAR